MVRDQVVYRLAPDAESRSADEVILSLSDRVYTDAEGIFNLWLDYSAADVMIVPSLQEAFGQTASESMACGTPVVAFAHSGLLDIVEHKKTGYLAKPYEIQDLSHGINWILNSTNYNMLSKFGREKIIKEFNSPVVADRYIEMYQKILRN